MPFPKAGRHMSRSTQPHGARYSDMWVIKEAGGSSSKPQQPDLQHSLAGPHQPQDCRPGDVPEAQSKSSTGENEPEGGRADTNGGAEQQRTLFIDTGVYTRNSRLNVLICGCMEAWLFALKAPPGSKR
eukprot:scaffold24452_cov22-Tisochrysis_lutea.AAC.1